MQTAPRDGQIVILEDDASAPFDVAHRSPEAGHLVDRSGDPIAIRPTRDKHLPQDSHGSGNPSLVESPAPPSWRRIAAYAITAVIVVAAMVGMYFRAEVAAHLTRSADRQNVVVSTIGEHVTHSRLPSQERWKATLLSRQQRIEADQAPEGTLAKQALGTSAPRQSLDTDHRTAVLANELAQARRAINRLNLQLRAGVANSAQLLGEEREKAAVFVKELASVRHELDEERARRIALANELTTARTTIEALAALLPSTSDETIRIDR